MTFDRPDPPRRPDADADTWPPRDRWDDDPAADRWDDDARDRWRDEPLFAPREPEPELPGRGPVRPERGPLRRIGGTIVVGALALWKIILPALGALKALKFFTTGFSFLVSVAAYALLWGWRFALGFTLLLFVHELGHVIQLRREGVPTSPVLFIPFVGAVVGMKELPSSGWVEAKVGLAGPVLGTVGAAATLALAQGFDSDFLRALAYTAFFLNLFNLIPIVPLDGGRAAAVFHPVVWLLGLFLLAFLYFAHPNPIILLVLLLGGFEVWNRWSRRNEPAQRAYRRATTGQRVVIAATYLTLLVVLILGMDVSYIERDL
jgi:Zn-dependent protease